MIKGSRVRWTTAGGVKGSGVIVQVDEDGMHHWVAVDAPAGEEHRVIYCAETWLTLIEVSGG